MSDVSTNTGTSTDFSRIRRMNSRPFMTGISGLTEIGNALVRGYGQGNSLASFAVLQFGQTTWMLFVFAGVYGFAHGGFFTVMSPALAEFFGTGSHGVIFGIVLFSGTIGGAIGPLLAGILFDANGNYELVFLILTGFGFLGLLMTSALRPIRRQLGETVRETSK